MKDPPHSWLIYAAAAEVRSRCRECDVSRLSRQLQGKLVELNRALSDPFPGNVLANDRSEALLVLGVLESVLSAADPRAVEVCRLRIEGDQVLLDGSVVPLDMTAERRETALFYLGQLLAAHGDWRSRREIDEEADHREGTRWDRVRLELPACLIELIPTNRRKGSRLTPDLWKTSP
jgi:hypothetical protein